MKGVRTSNKKSGKEGNIERFLCKHLQLPIYNWSLCATASWPLPMLLVLVRCSVSAAAERELEMTLSIVSGTCSHDLPLQKEV